ncbi:MAG: amidophosphoribosyltransferase [Actinomycetota bacterium]
MNHCDSHDAPREECGVIGLSSTETNVAQQAFFGLFALQHRGQEAAGIAVADGAMARLHKDVGLVSQVFTPERLAPLTGSHAIGHTRYSTTGAPGARNAQPFLVETMYGPLALAHNGNLVNAAYLRAELLTRGFGLTASSDTEVMTLMLAAAKGDAWEDRLASLMPLWIGAYSLVVLVADTVLAARDPWGFRPLSVGRLPDGGHAVASETCALRTLGCTEIEEVQPGEIVVMNGQTIRRIQAVPSAAKQARCTFEFIYFSRPDSEWDDTSVHGARQLLGERLAIDHLVDADVVVPVPDSSIPAAIGYSRVSGIPYNDGLIKNRYIGRTFIEPTQEMRARRVAMKFNSLPDNLAGKRVVLIDDSLVRGTTAGPLVTLLREAGASEVHVRITCPPIISACHFGVDMGHDDDLIAAHHSVEEMRDHIGADSLAFLSVESMMVALARRSGYCNGCFTGVYPVEISKRHSKSQFDQVLA